MPVTREPTENCPIWISLELCECCTKECGYMGPHTFYRILKYRYDLDQYGYRINESISEVHYPRPEKLEFPEPLLFRIRRLFKGQKQ